jgi:hypothetical protein
MTNWFRLCVAISVAAFASGCAAELATVERGPQPESVAAGQVVESPPPRVRVEVIPLRRNPSCRFRDGYYRPRGTKWIWVPGAWVAPPDGCYYAPPETRYERRSSGTELVYLPGAFFDKTSGKKCPPPPACP